MSKRRAVVLSVVLEGRSQAETARLYEVSESWVSRLVARYRTEGDAAFEARSRRPRTSPGRTPTQTIERIIGLRAELGEKGLDDGPATIAWHLEDRFDVVVSTATIWRHLHAAGLIEPQPQKRPRSSYIRFEADLPNETWQSDFTHWFLANRTDTEIISWLDDHSRFALSSTAHPRVTTPIVITTFNQATARYGRPASVLTDNGMVYTTRFAGGRGGRNRFETTLRDLEITQKHSRPNHPTTCGKVERYQQTLKKWLTAQPRATTLAELQDQLDAFVDEYNHRRPHRSLGRATPAAAYERLPKAQPAGSRLDDHHRVRHDRIDKSGCITLRHATRLHHIGIGRAHAGTPVIVIADDLDVRVIEATSGELLRHLTLDPTRDYQPTGRPPGPPPKPK